MKNLVAADENSKLWDEAILPIDDINLEIPEASLKKAVTTAYENRRELKQNETSRSINEINRRFYEDRTKPQN